MQKRSKLTINAPAKLNLHLAVKERRSDGFHNLESIFVAVDFGDTLHFEQIPEENALELVMEGQGDSIKDIPIEKNIIFRALSLFREKTGFCEGLRIRVEKRIPLGGGLGGGSSNAASALLALNKLSGELSREALLEMAARLGSDVPFFACETPAAWVTGRGENVRPIEAPDCFFVLVNPGFHSDTGAAFRLLAESRAKNFQDNSCGGSKEFFNDFLPVFPEPQKSVYENIIFQLQDYGADFAGLSGSGSTCFGMFKQRVLAEKTAENMRKKWNFAEICRPNKRFSS